MQVNKIIDALVEHSGMTAYDVSRAMDRAPAYISVARRARRSPTLETCARIADVAGVDLVAVDRKTGASLFTIEPPASVNDSKAL